MPIIPAGQEPDREYHRLQPIASDPKAHTEAERLESLRKVACNNGADAVIEAVNEEVRGDNAQYQLVSSGTAVIWLKRAGEMPRLQSLPAAKKPTPIGAPTADAPTADAAPAAEPTAAPTATPATAKSGKPVAGKPPKPGTKPIAPPPPKN